jgi:hypothetical protein
VGQAPVDAVIERCSRGIKISPDLGAPYAAEECVHVGHPGSSAVPTPDPDIGYYCGSLNLRNPIDIKGRGSLTRYPGAWCKN